MALNRAPFNALVDDDGSNTTGTIWNKAQIQAVVLDPVDAGAAFVNQSNTFQQAQYLQHAQPQLVNIDTSAPADSRVFRMYNGGQSLWIDALNDGMGVQQGVPLRCHRNGDVRLGRDVYEKARSMPMGHYIAEPFNPGNFLANGATLTVSSAVVNRYARVGEMVTWTLTFAGVLSAVSPTIYLRPPVGTVPAVQYDGSTPLALFTDNAGVFMPGRAYVENGATISVVRTDPPGALIPAGNVSVAFTIIFQSA